MKHTCGAWYTRCETCGKKNICLSCEATRADAWSPMCKRCEGQRLHKPKVTKEALAQSFNTPELSNVDVTWSLGSKMVKHISQEALGFEVKVTRGRGQSTWAAPWRQQVNLGIKYVRHIVEVDPKPVIYATEQYLWRHNNWTSQKAMWYVAIHEVAHIYNHIEFKGRMHDNGFKRSVKELQTLFPYDEVMEAVQ